MVRTTADKSEHVFATGGQFLQKVSGSRTEGERANVCGHGRSTAVSPNRVGFSADRTEKSTQNKRKRWRPGRRHLVGVDALACEPLHHPEQMAGAHDADQLPVV